MNKSIIKIFTLAVALVFATATGVDAQKVGHMSSQEVFLEMPETKKTLKELEDYRKQLSSQLEGRQKTLQQKIQDGNKKAQEGVLTPIQIKALEEEIQTEGAAIEKKVGELEQQYAKREIDALKPLEEKFMNAIKQVADENGYAYVLETAGLLHANPADNITAKVKSKLGM